MMAHNKAYDGLNGFLVPGPRLAAAGLQREVLSIEYSDCPRIFQS
jgi:hypothetical protein